MPLATELREYLDACFAGVWIESDEHQEAIAEISELCRQEAWRLAVWDLAQGIQLPLQSSGELTANDPLSAVRLAGDLAEPAQTSLLLLVNYHRFLGSPEIIQALAQAIEQGKRNRTFVILLSPQAELPRELEKLFVVLRHELPSRDQLASIARELATGDELPTGQELEAVLDAAAGLTRYEAEGAFSLSLVRDRRLTPPTILSIKAQQLQQSNLVTMHDGHERFSDLGGLAALKAFCLRALRPRPHDSPVQPKGVLLLSPPGCGKSAIAKALGNEVNRPTLRLDLGALMGSLVGQTEANTRRAIAIIEAMAPCLVFIDEIDKGLSGVNGNAGDSGVSARMFGTLLTWLSDRTSQVMVIATANSVERLPPEFLRAERFDGVFFLDLPTSEERAAIWKIHRQALGIAESETQPPDEGWTGAEIRACCRLSALLDVPLTTAAQQIVPVSVSAAEQLTSLRDWASGRCLSAHEPGIYQAPLMAKKRRSVRLDPSAN
jgi:hypothetical protein